MRLTERTADAVEETGHKKRGWLVDAVLAVLIFFLAVLLLTKAVTGYATFFGYKPVYILTDSMEPAIPAGSWVVAVPARAEEIAVGDVAAYRKENGTELQPLIIHRVVGITESGFIFQGDNNSLPDSWIVGAEQIMYKIVYPDVSQD
ncbi:MAG: signal peptidase I [Lachnospiraceae bacterium]|nr:signal peptidase I [Lachnospiraceae bacterium]